MDTATTEKYNEIRATASSDIPQRPQGVYQRINRDFTKEFINVGGYTMGQSRVLGTTIDEVEIEINFETYERMENDSTISKAKKILITNVLSDDLQFSPGATEEEVGEEEYKTFVEVMNFCQRVIGGLDRPFRKTLEMLLGNAIRYGHGIGEIEWEYRTDGPLEQQSTPRTPQKSRLSSIFSKWGFSSAETTEEDNVPTTKRSLKGQKTRLMPKAIKVKPRGRALFVVDDYMNVLGLVPYQRDSRTGLAWNEIIDREKFTVLTMNEQDEDPRGRSTYRPAWNWFNLKAQIPAEMLRFILQESVPQAVGTLPQDAPAFEFERDEQGNIVYEDPDTMKVPKMKTAAESMGDQIKGFRSGSGAVIPYGAKLEPFKRNGASDADVFPKIIKTINDGIEDAILNQTLAQSEGSHQARSAAQQVAELLYALTFWMRWGLAMMTLTDICETAVYRNLGEWALKYMPQISLGDFVRRDWGDDLAKLADAYFKGLLDDTQRAAIMAWMGLPPPGPSQREMAEIDPTTGEARMPNNQRPDKQPGQKDNRTKPERKNGESTNENFGLGSLNALGHHGRRFARSARALLSRR